MITIIAAVVGLVAGFILGIGVGRKNKKGVETIVEFGKDKLNIK